MASFTTLEPDLPVLGVGASLSFGVEPDPVALYRSGGGPGFIEYAGAVEPDWLGEGLRALQDRGAPLLYHPSCLNLCGPWPNPPEWVDAVARHVAHVDSAWLAQDVAICFASERPGYSNQLGYFVPPILDAEGLEMAVQRVEEVTSRLEDRVLLLEPAPVTVQWGEMSIFAWLSELAERTDCGILLDAGHVVSHQLAAGRELLAGLDELAMDRVIEIHVAGGSLHRTTEGRAYVDAHDLPILPETWRVLHHLVGEAPRLRAVCVECEGIPAHTVLSMLEKTRQRVGYGTANPALEEHIRGGGR